MNFENPSINIFSQSFAWSGDIQLFIPPPSPESGIYPPPSISNLRIWDDRIWTMNKDDVNKDSLFTFCI